MPRETLNPLHITTEFAEFTSGIKAGIPSHLRRPFIERAILRDDVPLEDQISAAWDGLGKSYLLDESLDAYATTMLALLEHCRVPAVSEKWLSLGSGPGIYELFLAKRFPKVSVTSVELSPEQVNIQRELLEQVASKSPAVRKRLNVVQGSMTNLGDVGGDYNQILCINSLPWSSNWRAVIAGVEKALSRREGSRVFTTMGSVSSTNGQRVISPDLDTDTLIEEFEKYGLRAKAVGTLSFIGQHGLFTPRFYGSFERTSKMSEPWETRVLSGKTTITDYDAHGGIIKATTLNSKE
jgi:hypothetical protein